MNPVKDYLNADSSHMFAPAMGALSTTFPKTITPGKTTTPVVTSKMADDHIQKMGTAIDQSNQDIANATQVNAGNAAMKTQKEDQQKQQDIENEQNAKPEDEIAKLMSSLNGNEEQQGVVSSNKEANKLDKTYLTQVGDAIDQMNAGTYPLSPTEQASINNVKSSFTGAFKAAEDLMKNQVGGQNVLNAKNGLQMYSPQEAISNIAKRVKEGNEKIAEVNANLLDSQNKLTQAFKDQDFKTATSLYNKIGETIKERNDEINDINKSVADQRKELMDNLKVEQDKMDAERTRQDKIQAEVVQNKNNILLSLGKSMTPVPPEVIQAVNDAPDVASAVSAAGPYLQDVPTSGIVGEYLFYKKQAEQAGQAPVDFNTYQNMDANRKAKATASANPSGLSPTVLTKVNTVANQFDTNPIVKQYNTIAEQLQAIKTLGSSPTDDIQRVYSFAKVMDPNSSVREGEYKTVQDYSQAVLKAAGLNAKRYFTSTGFLTDEARGFIQKTLQNRLSASEKNYNNVYSEFGRKINNMTGGKDGADYLTDYAKGYTAGDSLLETGAQAKGSVDDYIKNNPKQADTIARMYEVEGTSDQDVVDYLRLQKLIP